MNAFDSLSGDEEAVLDYGDAEFHIIKPGAYVRCAITGKKISLKSLKYWNVDKQEAYADAGAAMQGFGLETKK